MPFVFHFCNKYCVDFMIELTVQNIYKLNFLTFAGNDVIEMWIKNGTREKNWDCVVGTSCCTHVHSDEYTHCGHMCIVTFLIFNPFSIKVRRPDCCGLGLQPNWTCAQHFTKLKPSGIEWKKMREAKQRNTFFIRMHSGTHSQCPIEEKKMEIRRL